MKTAFVIPLVFNAVMTLLVAFFHPSGEAPIVNLVLFSALMLFMFQIPMTAILSLSFSLDKGGVATKRFDVKPEEWKGGQASPDKKRMGGQQPSNKTPAKRKRRNK